MSRSRGRPAWGVSRPALAVVLVALGAGLGGCRGDRSDAPPRQFFPDMDDQPRHNPQAETQFHADGRTMRPPVEGAVAFGVSPVISEASWNAHAIRERELLLKDDDRVFLGKNADGTYVQRMPVPVTEELLARGRSRFDIYCSACHGYAAEGATPAGGGMVGRRWSYPVPALTQDVYKPGGDKGQDGYLFTVVRQGVWGPDGANKMPGYAHALDEGDAWAVVAYLRVLQTAASATINDAPPAAREALEGRRAAPPAVGDAAAGDAAAGDAAQEGGS